MEPLNFSILQPQFWIEHLILSLFSFVFPQEAPDIVPGFQKHYLQASFWSGITQCQKKTLRRDRVLLNQPFLNCPHFLTAPLETEKKTRSHHVQCLSQFFENTWHRHFTIDKRFMTDISKGCSRGCSEKRRGNCCKSTRNYGLGGKKD